MSLIGMNVPRVGSRVRRTIKVYGIVDPRKEAQRRADKRGPIRVGHTGLKTSVKKRIKGDIKY